MLAKITSKNQLTLPKSVTQALGPVQYFEVQAKDGQIILTPVRIQRGDALRAKLAELDISEKTMEAALAWAAETAKPPKKAASKTVSTPPKAAGKKAAKAVVKKTVSKASVKTATKTAAKALEKPPVTKKTAPMAKRAVRR